MTGSKRLVTVFGGTGNQGRAVVQSLLSHKDRIFEARVVTRDPTSPQALEVAGLGASLARADGFNMAEIAAALEGSWGVFINSNSDGQYGDEYLHQKNSYDLDVNVLDAAAAVGVKHVVYSSAANTHRATKGRIHIMGFDSKSYVEEYALSRKSFVSFTPVLPASFMECWTEEAFCRLWGGFPWYRAANSEVVLAMPPYGGDGRMPWVSLQDDFGDIVHGIFLDPSRYDRVRVQAISQMVTFEQLAKEYTHATASPVSYQPLASWTAIPHDGGHLSEDARSMFFYMNFCGGKWFAEYETDMTASRECKEAAVAARGVTGAKLTTFREWFQRELKHRLGD